MNPNDSGKDTDGNNKKKSSKGSTTSFLDSLPSRNRKRRQCTLAHSKRSKNSKADDPNASTSAALSRGNTVASSTSASSISTVPAGVRKGVDTLKRNLSIESAGSTSSGASLSIPLTSGIRYNSNPNPQPSTGANAESRKEHELLEQILFRASQEWFNSQSQASLQLQQQKQKQENQKLAKDGAIIDLSASSSQENSQEFETHRLQLQQSRNTADRLNENQNESMSSNTTTSVTTQSSQVTSHSAITAQISNLGTTAFEEDLKTKLFNHVKSTFESESINIYKKQLKQAKDENMAMTDQLQYYKNEIKRCRSKLKQQEQEQQTQKSIKEYESKMINCQNENKSLRRQVMKLQQLVIEKDRTAQQLERLSKQLYVYRDQMFTWLNSLGFTFDIDERTGEISRSSFVKRVKWILPAPPPIIEDRKDCTNIDDGNDHYDNGDDYNLMSSMTSGRGNVHHERESEYDQSKIPNDNMMKSPLDATRVSMDDRYLSSTSSTSTRTNQLTHQLNTNDRHEDTHSSRTRHDKVTEEEVEEKEVQEDESQSTSIKASKSTDIAKKKPRHVRNMSMSSSSKSVKNDDPNKAFSVTKINHDDQQYERLQPRKLDYVNRRNHEMASSSSTPALDQNKRIHIKKEDQGSHSLKQPTSTDTTVVKRKSTSTPWSKDGETKRCVTPGSMKSKANIESSSTKSGGSSPPAMDVRSSKREVSRDDNKSNRKRAAQKPFLPNQGKKKNKKVFPIRDVSNNKVDHELASTKSNFCQPIDESSSTAPTNEGRPNFRGGVRSSIKQKKKAIRFQEVVRGKKARELLRGFSCPECDAFLDAVCNHAGGEVFDRNVLESKCSRHRALYSPPKTPDGFWDLSFVDERNQADDNDDDNDRSQF